MRHNAASMKRFLWSHVPRSRSAAWIAAAATVGATLVLYLLGDRWWPVLPFLYGPRWVLFVLPLATLPWLFRRRVRGVVPAAIAWSVFAVGIMGVRAGPGRWTTEPGISLRVIEFNIGGSAADVGGVSHWLATQDASIIVLIECVAARGKQIAAAMGLHVATGSSICVLSRYPIDDWRRRDQREFWKEYGSAAIALATIRHPLAGPLRIGSVHLATPRHALDTFRDLSELPSRGPLVERNQALRDAESAAARDWLGGPTDVTMIVGDFNLPVESTIYRRHWGDFVNGFSRAGIGAGYTKYTRLFGVRIDHVLLGAQTDARRVRVGPGLGSDHRPLIADLVVPEQAQRTTVAR